MWTLSGIFALLLMGITAAQAKTGDVGNEQSVSGTGIEQAAIEARMLSILREPRSASKSYRFDDPAISSFVKIKRISPLLVPQKRTDFSSLKLTDQTVVVDFSQGVFNPSGKFYAEPNNTAFFTCDFGFPDFNGICLGEGTPTITAPLFTGFDSAHQVVDTGSNVGFSLPVGPTSPIVTSATYTFTVVGQNQAGFNVQSCIPFSTDPGSTLTNRFTFLSQGTYQVTVTPDPGKTLCGSGGGVSQNPRRLSPRFR